MDDSVCVLVVEDEPLVRIDIADYLIDQGFDVIEAADADEAIRVLEGNAGIRLIITDVDMPGTMDGLMLARAVVNRWPPIRIIVVSGHRNVEITDIPDGTVFFAKPYRHDVVVSSMRELLAH